jgi:hypothetical protein
MVKLRGFAHLRRKAKEVRPPARPPAVYPFRCVLRRSIGLCAGSISAGSLDRPLWPISSWLSATAIRRTTASKAERCRARTWKRSSLQSGASSSTQRRAHAKRSRSTAPRTTGRRRRSLSGWVSRHAPQQGRTARRMGFPPCGVGTVPHGIQGTAPSSAGARRPVWLCRRVLQDGDQGDRRGQVRLLRRRLRQEVPRRRLREGKPNQTSDSVS